MVSLGQTVSQFVEALHYQLELLKTGPIVVPKRRYRISILHFVMSQKTTDLICVAAAV
jgi:hypothetical protein